MNKSNAEKAAAFLMLWPNRTIFSIEPEKGYPSAVWVNSEAEAVQLLEKLEGVENVYFMPNSDMRDTLSIETKMSNDFVGACYAVYIDIDCLKIGLSYDAAIASLTTKLPAGIPGPCSGIIFSGGGVQGYWLLRVPFYCGGEVDKLHYFKMRLCGVIEAYQGSADNAVQAACQAMRLAWTWNLPDLNKQRLGRSKALASVIIWNPGRVYDLEEFPVKEDAARPLLGWQVKENERLAYAMVAEPVFIESLDQLRISDKCKRLIAQGNDDGEIHNQEEYSIIMHMLRVGVPPNVVLGVITDTRFLIGSYEATKKEDNARRQIVRALVRLTIERGIELDQLKNERFEDDDDSGE